MGTLELAELPVGYRGIGTDEAETSSTAEEAGVTEAIGLVLSSEPYSGTEEEAGSSAPDSGAAEVTGSSEPVEGASEETGIGAADVDSDAEGAAGSGASVGSSGATTTGVLTEVVEFSVDLVSLAGSVGVGSGVSVGSSGSVVPELGVVDSPHSLPAGVSEPP